MVIGPGAAIGLWIQGLASLAAAAPVVCDPQEAARLVSDARIDEQRVPVTHPWLVPGLARSADAAAAEAVAAECNAAGELVVERAEQYGEAGWAAYVVVLSRVEREGCTLVHHRTPLSVGIGADGPTYSLRGTLPPERTPIDGCAEPAEWREETVIAGEGGDVRLVLAVDHVGASVSQTQVAVRTATPRGWAEQTLIQPAPPRLLDPSLAGPVVSLAHTRSGEALVVQSHSRTPSPCRAVGGQTVWTRGDDGRWLATTGRDALTVLAREGLWRYAGDDGWLLILAEDDEKDLYLMEPRRRRLQRRDPEPLYLLHSADFPLLNPDYVLVTPAPWPTEAEAAAARGRWRRSSWARVKHAWVAPDPCE